MNTLNLNLINAHSEYLVWLSPNGKYLFKTNYDILYAVDFELDSNPYFTAYWSNLTNLEHQSSPGDPKIPQTVICIIEEFFRQNPDILLYMCSTEGGQQAQRARLFLRWFNGSEQNKYYVARSVEIHGEDSRKEYVAIIVQRSNPQLQNILAVFEKETTMFNELKSQP